MGQSKMTNAMSNSDPLVTDLKDGILTLRLNRPERLNALSSELITALLTAFDAAASDDDVIVVVITGTGDRAFCAGRDLKELGEQAAETARVRPRSGVQRSVFEALIELYKPTIASMNGLAVGGGFELALACDLRVAVQGAVVGMPDIKRGLPTTFGTVALLEMVPRAVAYELFYSGRLVPVAELSQWGLFNKIVEAKDLAEATYNLASEICEGSPIGLQRYKHLGTKSWGLPLSTALRIDPGPDVYASVDAQEGIRAFIEKRNPRWASPSNGNPEPRTASRDAARTSFGDEG
jgi:enoyl-CoA hydratase